MQVSLVDDCVSIVTLFCNRIYGRNRKKKTMDIIIGQIRNEKEK